MNVRSLAHVLVKVAALVYIALQLEPPLTFIADLFAGSFRRPTMAFALSIVPLTIGLFLWYRSDMFVAAIMRSLDAANPLTEDGLEDEGLDGGSIGAIATNDDLAGSLQAVAISLLGVVLMAISAPGLISALLHLAFDSSSFQDSYGTRGTSVSLFIYLLVKLGIGLMLFYNGANISRYWQRIRQRPITYDADGSESDA